MNNYDNEVGIIEQLNGKDYVVIQLAVISPVRRYIIVPKMDIELDEIKSFIITKELLENNLVEFGMCDSSIDNTIEDVIVRKAKTLGLI